MDLKEMGWQGVDRINVAQDKDKWWGLCISIVNAFYHKM